MAARFMRGVGLPVGLRKDPAKPIPSKARRIVVESRILEGDELRSLVARARREKTTVQCVLNALFDLKTVFFMNNPFATSVPNDAMNMAQATGIPGIFWTVIWIALALGILWFAMRLYVAGRDKGYQPDLPFEDTPPV